MRNSDRWVHSELLLFIRADPGGRQVHSGSFGSFAGHWGVVRFICVSLVNSGTPWPSSGSFAFACFIPSSPGGGRVHKGSFERTLVRAYIWSAHLRSFNEFRCATAIAGFIRNCYCSLGRTPEVVRYIRVRLVHSDASRVSSGSFAFVWFILTRPGCRMLHYDPSLV